MNSQILRSEAAKELLNRRSIRRSLTEWARLCGFEPAKHHLLLIDALEAVERGDLQNLAVFMPPGSAKSTYSSVLFTAWLMCRQNANVLAAAHTTELAEKWGRRVRNLIAEYRLVLGIDLAADSQAAGRWSLTNGAEYYAAGVGTGIAGFRAKFGLIDDPIRSRQDADSELIRDRIWDWYINDFRTRLVPNARKILIQCMTGDTPVLMATGHEKPLRDIRPGDRVATYENGRVSVSTVRNWVNHGPDRVFTIRTKSGITVKANARHPFLVEDGGELKWQRTDRLKRGCVIPRVTGASGLGSFAPQMDARNQPSATAGACRTTISTDGHRGFGRLQSIPSHIARRICATAMELICRITSAYSLNRAASALFADNRLPRRMFAPIGMGSFASITATTATRSGDFFATTAISQLDMARQNTFSAPPLSTFGIINDTIEDIVDSGVEDVFDVEIERTENFIANGLISHNTRWHEDDLAGRALNHEPWHVISIPAIAEADDALGRKVGEPLWADGKYGYGQQILDLQKNTPARTWSALYQQRPAPDTGDYFRREWFRYYDTAPPLNTLNVYMGADFAVTSGGGDYTAIVTVGIDPNGDMWLLDVSRMQASSDVWAITLADLIKRYKPQELAEETGQIRSGVGPFLNKVLLERNAHVYRRVFPTRGDKAVRAQSIRGRMAMRGLYIPANAPWRADFEHELLSFPATKHDDMVDALALVGMTLDHQAPGRVPKDERVVPKDLVYEVQADGILRSNMSVLERVMQKQRAKERH